MEIEYYINLERTYACMVEFMTVTSAEFISIELREVSETHAKVSKQKVGERELQMIRAQNYKCSGIDFLEVMHKVVLFNTKLLFPQVESLEDIEVIIKETV